MKTLIIKDLAITESLDAGAMSAVRGGYSGYSSYSYCMKVPSCYPYPAKSPVTSTTTVTVDQSNQQGQSNATGNNSATFGGGIHAENNQQAFNVLGGFGGSRMLG
jgi:hypothetical protein